MFSFLYIIIEVCLSNCCFLRFIISFWIKDHFGSHFLQKIITKHVVTFENGGFSIAWSVQGGSPLGWDYTVGYIDFYSPLGTKLGTTLRPFGDGQQRSPGEMKFEGSTVDDLKIPRVRAVYKNKKVFDNFWKDFLN